MKPCRPIQLALIAPQPQGPAGHLYTPSVVCPSQAMLSTIRACWMGVLPLADEELLHLAHDPLAIPYIPVYERVLWLIVRLVSQIASRL